MLQEDIEMKMRNNASHASAAIREDFAVLEAAQVKMHQQLQHFQTDISKQMSSVMHVLHDISDQPLVNSQILPEPNAPTGNRYRVQSANPNPGPPQTEFMLSSPPTAGNRNRAQSASQSGMRGRNDSVLSQASTRERSRSSIRDSFVASSSTIGASKRYNERPITASFDMAGRSGGLTFDALKRKDEEDDRASIGQFHRLNSRRHSNVSANSDGGLSTSGAGPY